MLVIWRNGILVSHFNNNYCMSGITANWCWLLRQRQTAHLCIWCFLDRPGAGDFVVEVCLPVRELVPGSILSLLALLSYDRLRLTSTTSPSSLVTERMVLSIIAFLSGLCSGPLKPLKVLSFGWADCANELDSCTFDSGSLIGAVPVVCCCLVADGVASLVICC